MRRILRDAAKKSISNPPTLDPPTISKRWFLMRISRESWKLGFNIINKISKLSGDSVDDAYESIEFASKDHKNEEWRTELLNEVLDMFE